MGESPSRDAMCRQKMQFFYVKKNKTQIIIHQGRSECGEGQCEIMYTHTHERDSKEKI